tara:strand:- start:105 stop:641 length:537 start_codon:yes stop_codon:yes gene_type:complete
MKKKKNKKSGILFWLTGLSGSGKTSIGKKIFPYIKKKFGNTIILSGDELRQIFNLNKYDYHSRIRYLKFYSNFCKKITDQGTNVILCVVGLSEQIRTNNRKKFLNYTEIYIKSNVALIKKFKRKKIYLKNKNIWGIDIKPDLPKKPDIIIVNNFSKSINELSKELMKKLEKKFLDEKF